MDKPNEILLDVVQRTFESLAFMMPAMEEEAACGAGENMAAQATGWKACATKNSPFATVTVAFEGPLKGELALRVSQKLLAPLATNMLGLEMDDAPPSASQQIDALKELLNVICGNLLPEIAGKQAVCNLQTPQVKSLEEGSSGQGWDEKYGPPRATASLALDEGWTQAALWLKDSADAAASPQRTCA